MPCPGCVPFARGTQCRHRRTRTTRTAARLSRTSTARTRAPETRRRVPSPPRTSRRRILRTLSTRRVRMHRHRSRVRTRSSSPTSPPTSRAPMIPMPTRHRVRSTSRADIRSPALISRIPISRVPTRRERRSSRLMVSQPTVSQRMGRRRSRLPRRPGSSSRCSTSASTTSSQ